MIEYNNECEDNYEGLKSVLSTNSKGEREIVFFFHHINVMMINKLTDSVWVWSPLLIMNARPSINLWVRK